MAWPLDAPALLVPNNQLSTLGECELLLLLGCLKVDETTEASQKAQEQRKQQSVHGSLESQVPMTAEAPD